MSDYTPSAEKLQEAYEYWVAGLGSSDGLEVERFLAAHDLALREQIARKIEARRNEPGQIELADRFGGYHAGQSAGLDLAAQIVRREGSE